MKYVNQEDIAKILNVSRITVSKALRDHPDISVGLKQKVKHLARELGYSPNLIARSLSSKKSFTIGVVVPDIGNLFFASAIKAIIGFAAEQGYHTILTASQENEETERENIKNLLSMRVDGLLVSIAKNTVRTDVYDIAKKMRIPLIFFDRYLDSSDFSRVVVDDKRSAVRAVEYLIQCGYTKIAHFAGDFNMTISRERCAGYREALKNHNLHTKDEWIIECGFEKDNGYKYTIELYETNKLPEVIFAVNSLVAYGVYVAAREIGLKIPDELGVISFGHSDFANLLSPRLAIIEQNPAIIGKKATRLLINEINKNTNKRKIVIPAELILNGSIRDNYSPQSTQRTQSTQRKITRK